MANFDIVEVDKNSTVIETIKGKTDLVITKQESIVVTEKEKSTLIVSNNNSEIITSQPQGLPGRDGVDGHDGIDGDRHFSFEQSLPSNTWVVTHNLNKFPSVTVIDSANTEVEGGVEFIDINTVQISFSAAFSGKAYLN